MCSTYFLKSKLGQSVKTCKHILDEISFQTKLKYVNIIKRSCESLDQNGMRKQYDGVVPAKFNRSS